MCPDRSTRALQGGGDAEDTSTEADLCIKLGSLYHHQPILYTIIYIYMTYIRTLRLYTFFKKGRVCDVSSDLILLAYQGICTVTYEGFVMCV